MTRFFIDKNGMYIGGFDGAPAPIDAIEVPNPPLHAFEYKYVNGAWEKIVDVQKDREAAYLKAGITDQAVITAVKEFYFEDKSDALDELKAKKQAVDLLIPK